MVSPGKHTTPKVFFLTYVRHEQLRLDGYFVLQLKLGAHIKDEKP
jgi:hypothetical protein